MDPEIRSFILSILEHCNDLTLATLRRDGFPQANTVSYANDGLVLYFGSLSASNKIRNIRFSDKVSLAIDVPYRNWGDITGLSMAATATIVAPRTPAYDQAIDCLKAKFPAVWGPPPPPSKVETVAVVRLVPKVISVLNYRVGFGHTVLVRVRKSDVASPVPIEPAVK